MLQISRIRANFSDISRKSIGFSVVEVAIAGTILALIAGAATTLFNQYISSSASARKRNEISTIITRDSENLRNTANGLWQSSSTGTLVYSPPTAGGSCIPLAAASASENSIFKTGSTTLQIPAASSSTIKSAIISRSISHQGNIIIARYTSSTPVSVDYVSYILPAAQGWCP